MSELREVLATTYVYWFDLDEVPATLRTPPSGPYKDREVNVEVRTHLTEERF